MLLKIETDPSPPSGPDEVEYGSEMALSKSDKDWIERAISRAVQPAPSSESTAADPKVGLVHQIPLSLALPFVLALIAAVAWAVDFRSTTNGRLGTIEKEVSTIEKDLGDLSGKVDGIRMAVIRLSAKFDPGAALAEIADLEPEEVANLLSAVAEAASHEATEVEVSEQQLNKVGERLLETSEATPGYWGAVAQFIRFAGAKRRPEALESWTPPRNITIEDSMLEEVAIEVSGLTLRNVVCVNCHVIFGAAPAFLVNFTCTNCTYDFPINDDTPPPQLQLAMKKVLANPEQVRLGVGG